MLNIYNKWAITSILYFVAGCLTYLYIHVVTFVTTFFVKTLFVWKKSSTHHICACPLCIMYLMSMLYDCIKMYKLQLTPTVR